MFSGEALTALRASGGGAGLWIPLGLLCLAFAPPPGALPAATWATLAVAAVMAILWVMEPIPLAATALIPVAFLPLLGVMPIAEVAASYAHPLIFLFLGGFMIAAALERHEAPQAIGAAIMAVARGRPSVAIAGLMAASAVASMWISNTATAMILAPVAATVAVGRNDDAGPAALLGVAFAATIGGMASLIGTPPNALFAAYAGETLGLEIGFAEWMMFGGPVALALLPAAYLILTRFVFTIDRSPGAAPPTQPAPLGAGARRTLLVAGCAALGWVLRPHIVALTGWSGLTDAGIAVAAAFALFVLRDPRGGRLLDWEAARGVRWDVLILFGGGLALAGALERRGGAALIAGVVAVAEGAPLLLVVLLFSVIIVLTGELASNTAMAAIFLPIAGASAVGLGADPVAVLAPIALAASIGFMLPVATPPNAIVFRYPGVTRGAMLRAGAPLDLIGAALAAGAGYLIAPVVLS